MSRTLKQAIISFGGSSSNSIKVKTPFRLGELGTRINITIIDEAKPKGEQREATYTLTQLNERSSIHIEKY